jgi:hypothetical protein
MGLKTYTFIMKILFTKILKQPEADSELPKIEASYEKEDIMVNKNPCKLKSPLGLNICSKRLE